MNPYVAKKMPIEYDFDEDLIKMISEANLKYGEYKTFISSLDIDSKFF